MAQRLAWRKLVMKIRRVGVVLFAVVAMGVLSVLATSFAQDEGARVGDDEAGRLPVGYSAIVKKSQRKQIYAIQDKYQKQISVLQKQIDAIEQERDAEVVNVLSEEQKKILAFILKLRAEEKAENAKAAKQATAAGAGASN